MKIADLRRSSACSGSNCRLFAHITALGGGLPRVLSGLRLGNGTRGELRMLADVRFVSRPVLSAPQTRSASLPRRLRCQCSSAPLPAFRDPGAQQAVRPGRCAAGSSDLAYSRLARPLFLPVRRTRVRGRGGEGGTTIAFPSSTLGDARRLLSAPCRAQRAVRSGRCAEKSSVCSLARLIVWLLVLCGWQGKKGGRKKPRERATCPLGTRTRRRRRRRRRRCLSAPPELDHGSERK